MKSIKFIVPILAITLFANTISAQSHCGNGLEGDPYYFTDPETVNIKEQIEANYQEYIRNKSANKTEAECEVH